MALRQQGIADMMCCAATCCGLVWRVLTCRFREDVALRQRMQGIADIIAASGYPTFLCFQEVTPCIMQMFAAMPW